MKVRVAGKGVGSRAACGASCLNFCICRRESALAIYPRIVSNEYMKIMFGRDEEQGAD